MKTFRLIALLAVLQMTSANAFGQVPDDEHFFQDRAKELVGQMNDYISLMVDNTEPESKRWQYRMDCLYLFIGAGESFEINGRMRPGVKMEVTSLNNSFNKRTYSMKLYFTNLINLILKGKYTEVKITSTEVEQMKVSSLQKIADDFYECTVSFTQKFLGRRGESFGYGDYTDKKVKVYFKIEKTENGKELIPRLGDVSCGQTIPLNENERH